MSSYSQTGRAALRMVKPIAKLPGNSRQLVEVLKEAFPALNPSPGMRIEEVMYAAGARELIQLLEERLAAEQF